jgi:hypothetical protein
MTLMEIIVSVSLLVVIVTALLGAFNQTTRAFKTGFNQTDVLESGRAAIEMVTRVVTDLSPSGTGNLDPDAFSLNSPLQSVSYVDLPVSASAPRQRLFMQKLLLLHRSQDRWIRSAFLVAHFNPAENPGVAPGDVVIGSLYHYQTEVSCAVTNRDYLHPLLADSLLEPRDKAIFRINPIDPTRYSRVIDGVVHFSVRTGNVGSESVDSGHVTNRFIFQLGNSYTYRGERLPTFDQLGLWIREQDAGRTEAQMDTYTGAMLPSYVEVEIGVLENEALGQVRALAADKVSTAEFLRNNAHRVHFFRQRISIRSGISL